MEAGRVVAGRFVVEALAGQGGMGAVYRARDQSTQRTVALKILAVDASTGRVEQEARLLAELEHPAIVRYVAHGVTEDHRRFIAMEWLDGEDLGRVLARGPLTTDQTRIVARRVAEALVEAHARGIVHRDIKPANLFLPKSDFARLKVLDFGIARADSGRPFDSTAVPITKTGGVVGTVGYMSPEQARGRDPIDARTDVFALGCVLFECMTGRPAFSGANAVAVLAKVLLEEAPRTRHFAPTVPPELDELVARMLAKDPALRPRDATAVLRGLDVGTTTRSSGTSGVGDREQRTVTILLVRGVEDAVDDAISLADGARLVELRGHDPASAAAGRALAISREHPNACLAIATGRVSTDDGGAYGPIIDRVATLPLAPAAIVIDEVSARLLGDRFEIRGGCLLGPSRSTGAPRTLLGRETPFVGRDKELALLEATFRECIDEPVARATLVTGAAGAGKSRLTHELLARVKDDATVLIARADPVGAGGAFTIARQLVRAAAGLRESDPPGRQHAALRAHLDRFFAGDELARVAESLGDLAGAPSPTPSPELRAARGDARLLASWLSSAFGEWIAALTDARPLLCILEDLHWGDGASVAYFDEVLRSAAARPIMVLALARPEVTDLFPSLWARAGLQEIRLQPLTRRAAERLVRSVLASAPDGLVGSVVDRAEGNAFYLEELIRQIADGAGDVLPPTLLALADARIARLDPEARRFLRVASVFGETFWESGVASLLAPEESHPDVVRRLVEHEVIVAASNKRAGEHRFRHGLLRDAAYAMLAREDRTVLHARAGAWLDMVGGHEPLVLAEHYERGAEPLRAASFFVDAAERASESWNLDLVASLVERGRRCGPIGDVLAGLHLLEAKNALAHGLHSEAVAQAKVAFEHFPLGSDGRYVAGAMILRSGVITGDLELAPRIVQELLAGVPDGPLSAAFGEGVSMAVDILDSVGQLEASERLLDIVEARIDDADAACRTYARYARAATSLRRDVDIGKVLRIVAGQMAAAEALGVSRAIDLFRFGAALLQQEIGNSAVARRLFTENLGSVGSAPIFAAWTSIHIGWCLFAEGRAAEAAVEASKAFELDPHHAYALAAVAHMAMGERTQAERLSERSLDGIEDGIVTPFVVSVANAVAAEIAVVGGRLDAAQRAIEKATAFGFCSPPLTRSFVGRRKIDLMLAMGADVREELAALRARIHRHARSLDDGDRASFLALTDHAYVLGLPHA